ncbi:MAG TPA: hypothetical protein DEP84_30355 [Chloroflexi bacterium]|nr:hypothetical protein [Chloroflexota bacterium]
MLQCQRQNLHRFEVPKSGSVGRIVAISTVNPCQIMNVQSVFGKYPYRGRLFQSEVHRFGKPPIFTESAYSH